MQTGNQIENADESLLVATFRLGDGLFGMDASIVEEVVLAGEITRVHDAPACVAGIRNLRGRIVTVLDPRVLLELGRIEPASSNRILIVDWKHEPIGVLVDEMADTCTTSRTSLTAPPPNLHGAQGEKLLGVFRAGEHLVALLDPAAVLEEGTAG